VKWEGRVRAKRRVKGLEIRNNGRPHFPLSKRNSLNWETKGVTGARHSDKKQGRRS